MNTAVEIDYTNWKGERAKRVIIPHPQGLFFGANQYHTEPQWLLNATDVEKNAPRTFALKDIHSWRGYNGS